MGGVYKNVFIFVNIPLKEKLKAFTF